MFFSEKFSILLKPNLNLSFSLILDYRNFDVIMQAETSLLHAFRAME